ncbi:MAG: hypothetical protein KatS3mg125_0313 [Lysobacterales bacterium]|jgi:hypothetical protein|nr:MAG: hypothetical protein KatS3mg125_0313 [Xanthomonadales bacterium]
MEGVSAFLLILGFGSIGAAAFAFLARASAAARKDSRDHGGAVIEPGAGGGAWSDHPSKQCAPADGADGGGDGGGD